MHHETDETQDVPGLHRDDEFLAPGATISRYLVLSTLGVGGMGIVYSAYDRSLDRKVAIKVLRSTADSALLLEEAKSMARVSHRNVVAIFDVGTVDGSVFLAMEHIDGVTLKDWIALAERSEAEIVQVMVAAGQGLAAAHQAGVIHRDFKPGNVIVGSDGRVVVTDFGIAHAVADAGAHSSKIGTPAYMAPETLKGALSDARSDQFSFAITLYEMLFGAHPFSRDNGEIARAIIAGELPDPPRDSRVSAPVQAATLRALAPEPEQRFPSVNSLLVELRKDPKAARRRGVGAALGAVGVAAVIGLFFIVGRDDPCGEYADRVSEVWNDTVRERIRGAFSNAALPFSDEAFTLTERALSRYASTWQAAQAASCRGEDPIAEASQELRILRAFCLEGRLKRFRSTVSLLEEANASEVEKAAGVVRALPAITDCNNVAALGREVPPPADPLVAGTVEKLRARLLDAQTMFNLGGVEPALALAKEIVAEAKNIDALALRAEAQLLYGRLLHSSGKTPEAQVQLRDGVASAIAADYDVLAFESWNALADAQGGAEPTEAGRYAEAYWIRLDRDPFLGAKLFTQRGMTALGAARHEDARKTLGEALRYLESSAYDDYPLEVRILGGLAAANAKVGKLTNAVEFNKRGQTLSASLFGEVNPQTLSLQLNRGNLLYLSGDYEGALETHQGLLHTYEALYGPEHKDTARTVFNIAVVNLALGNNDDALKMLERAVEIRTATLGPKHASTLRGEQAVVHTLKELARYDEAARRAEAVIQNQRETLGDDHYDIAYSLVTLAEVLGLQGKIDAGVQVGTDALAMIERVMGTGHPFYGEALTTVGEILARGARREEAISRFEGAIKTLKNYDGDATLIAKARFGWAKAAWANTAQRSRAREEAAEAAKIYKERGESSAEELRRVRAWLSDRPPIDG